MEIGSMNNIIQDLSLNSKNLSGEKKSNTTFEEIIKNEKNTNKVVEESNATEKKDKISENIEEVSETVESGKIVEESNATEKKDKISEKLEEVSKTVENGTDEEVLEAVMSLLQLLNIKIEDNTALPIKVDLSNVAIEPTDNSFLIENFLNNNNEKINLDLSIDINKEFDEDILSKVDNLLSLIEDVDGNKITKNQIFEVIGNEITKEVSFEEVSVKEDISNGIEIIKMVVNDESLFVTKNDDDILSKLLSEEITTSNLDEDTLEVKNNMNYEENGVFSDVISSLENRNVFTDKFENEPVTVTKETAPVDIVNNIKYMSRNLIQQLTVKVYPKELGEVTIKLLSEEGIMRADIKATSKETYNLLNSNLEEIKKYLNNENIEIKEVNISLYNEDTTYFSGQGFQEDNSENNERIFSEIDNYTTSSNVDIEEEIEINDSAVNLLA